MKADEFCTPIPKTYREPTKPRRLKASHGNKVPKPTLRALAKRARDRCEARTPRCWLVFEHPHHRQKKSQGVVHLLWNLLAVCEGCHGYIHDHEDWSRRHGFILGRGDDPEVLVPGCAADCELDHRSFVHPVGANKEGTE